MSFITLEILENKIKEIILMLKQIKAENDYLKKQINNKNKEEISPDLKIEYDKIKEQILKNKNNKTLLIIKIRNILKELNEIIGKE